MTVVSPPTPQDRKSQLRRDALRRRTAAHMRLAATAGTDMVRHGLELIARLPGRTVSGYMPIRDELDPVPLMTAIAALGHPVCLPVVEAKAAPLVFRAWGPGDTLKDASFGLKEPFEAAGELLPDILLVPGAAFDSAGYRIGYGGGYYDRTLALYRSARTVTAVGIAYDEQEVPTFPHEPHDQRLDFLLTPTGLRSFGA
jgi:5-formyltetrahydrofolate cyclo-ligase